MDELELQTRHLPHLRGQFANGSAVLFLGAGFSLGARNRAGEEIPSVGKLAKMLWQLCFGNDPFDETTQLQDIFETALTLRPKELRELLLRTFTIDPESCSDWYRELLTMPWLRIYTLNIDDLVTKILSKDDGSRALRIVSAKSTQDPMFDDAKLSVVHLNGSLGDAPNNVTFARSQYARRTGLDPAYVQLSNDLLLRSVVFIGSSMEEGPLWEHLEMRGSRGERNQRELRPRSYLVIPTLNRSKQALLSRYNIAWLPMNAEQFNAQVLSSLRDERVAGHLVLRRAAVDAPGSPDRILSVADLAARARPSEEYLLGAEPTWDDVVSNRVAKRDCFDELWEAVCKIRAKATGKSVIVLTGTAGTGKSSALMVAAMRLQADGVKVGWLDSTYFFSRQGFRQALSRADNLGALFINDADLYDVRLGSMIHDAMDHNPRMVVVCETRSAKVDRVLGKHELGDIEAVEYTIPSLGNSDIDAILDVLDREHRLGQLKGKSREERQNVFRRLAGRQLLVAMYTATHGRDFEEKVVEEMNDLSAAERFIYGLVCVAGAHRFALRQEDVGIAVGDEGTAWLQTLDALKRRKLLLPHGESSVSARHRVIAQLTYDALVEDGKLYEIVHALIKIAATKTTANTPKEAAHARLLRTFVNHNLMKRGVGLQQARQIYGDFEDALSWDHHFWLHRGALELETGNLPLAENFLRQAKSINESDVFIDVELAYLSFKKAIERPMDRGSPALVEEAIATLNDIATRRPDQVAHAYHIMGQQGLAWSKVGIEELDKKKEFLEYLLRKAKIAAQQEPSEMMRTLVNDVQRAVLSLAT